MIASGSGDGKIQLWESNTGKQLQCWKGHGSDVTGIAFSSNGQWISSCGFDKTIKLWNAHTGSILSSLSGHISRVNDIVFSPCDSLLASANDDKTVRLWDLKTIDKEPIEESNSDKANSIFSTDGKTVISANTSGLVRLYDALSGEVERTVVCGYSGVWIVAVSPDGLRVATTGYSNINVSIWSTESGILETVFVAHPECVSNIIFSPCGQIIATSGYGTTIHLWDVNTGALIRVLDGHVELAMQAYFSSDGKHIIEVGQDYAVNIWEVDTSKRREFNIRKNAKESFWTAKLSPISLQISVSEFNNCTISIWDQTSIEPCHVLKHDNPVNNFVWSYCEQWIAAHSKNLVYFWNKSPGKSNEWTCAVVVRDFYEVICSIDWKPNTLELVTTCEDGSIRVWRLMETLGEWSARLIWNAGKSVLIASGAHITDAIDLSPVNHQLLEQRG
ncbi:hypothetical protein FBU30_002048 [Linnemannia zychae]|nr:hypothetical protein FBU30_002048 [Linnemannia zychae]